jgi:hypothetical protein
LRIELLNAQRSADFQIGAIMPGFSNAPIWKLALQFMGREMHPRDETARRP